MDRTRVGIDRHSKKLRVFSLDIFLILFVFVFFGYLVLVFFCLFVMFF